MLSPFCQSLVVPYEGLTLSFCMCTCYVLIWLWDLIVLPLISIILLPSVSSCPISLICLSLKLMLLTIIFYPFQELFFRAREVWTIPTVIPEDRVVRCTEQRVCLSWLSCVSDSLADKVFLNKPFPVSAVK